MNRVVLAFIKLIITLVSSVFTPLDTFITNNIPSLLVPTMYVENFLTWLKDFVLWVLSWLPFNQNLWTLLIAYIILRITISASISIIKLVVHWWHYLAP